MDKSHDDEIYVLLCERRFIQEMQLENEKAGQLSFGTLFLNPHGMDESSKIVKEEREKENKNENHDVKNKRRNRTFHGSTARNMSKFAISLLKHVEIQTIVKSKKYQCTITNINKEDEDIHITTRRSMCWQNTNKMLWKNQHAMGLKTGWTRNAGPCLCSVMRVPIVLKNSGIVKSLRNLRSPRSPRSLRSPRSQHSPRSQRSPRLKSSKKIPRSERKYRKVLVLTLGSESKGERWVEHTRIHRWARKILSGKK